MNANDDKLAGAMSQAKAQFESIKEMVDALDAALVAAENSDDYQNQIEAAYDEANEAIMQDALSVEVRSGWYVPGSRDADTKPAEYNILLCTGGPAVRIIGELSEHGEPETATLQCQDWFTPWVDAMGGLGTDAEAILLRYASCFYFGE